MRIAPSALPIELEDRDTDGNEVNQLTPANGLLGDSLINPDPVKAPQEATQDETNQNASSNDAETTGAIWSGHTRSFAQKTPRHIIMADLAHGFCYKATIF